MPGNTTLYRVSEYTLTEVYQSKHVFFSDGRYPRGVSYSVTQVPGLYDIYKRRIRPVDQVSKLVDEFAKNMNFNANDRILGIHFRGQEQKLAPLHSFPPTEEQMIRYCNEIIAKYKIDRIFVVTEDQSYLDLFTKTYGEKVLSTNSYRTVNVNAYKLNPRENHRYLLGLEVLVDTYLLSKCTGLLCGDSNVSQLARFISNEQFEFVYQIVNGTNSPNPVIARYLYNWKKNFPGVFGPFKDQVLKIERTSDLSKK